MIHAVSVSLFSGVGGLDLAVELVLGARTVLLCEADPYCRAILRREWPGVPCEEDVRALDLSSFVVGSPAKTYPTSGSELASSRGIDRASGRTWLGAFAIWDRPSSSWRMSAGSLFEDSIAFSETFPASGTMRSGRLFERRTLAPRTSALASLSSEFDSSSRSASENSYAGSDAVSARRWPTPVTTDAKSAARGTTTTGVMHPGVTLTDAIRSHRCTMLRPTGLGGSEVEVLNPGFAEALMGLPPGWTHVDDGTASSALETEWCRSKQGMRSKDSSSGPSTTG